jgi:hypothetical protein
MHTLTHTHSMESCSVCNQNFPSWIIHSASSDHMEQVRKEATPCVVCTICNTSCRCWSEHAATKAHIEGVEAEDVLAGKYSCSLCCVRLANQDGWNTHLHGEHHRNNYIDRLFKSGGALKITEYEQSISSVIPTSGTSH